MKKTALKPLVANWERDFFDEIRVRKAGLLWKTETRGLANILFNKILHD
jgi:hypothetical protein